jgi:hypothetical protein
MHEKKLWKEWMTSFFHGFFSIQHFGHKSHFQPSRRLMWIFQILYDIKYCGVHAIERPDLLYPVRGRPEIHALQCADLHHIHTWPFSCEPLPLSWREMRLLMKYIKIGLYTESNPLKSKSLGPVNCQVNFHNKFPAYFAIMVDHLLLM